jgi:hypothetical protein
MEAEDVHEPRDSFSAGRTWMAFQSVQRRSFANAVCVVRWEDVLRLLALLLRYVGMSELGMRGNKVGLGMAAFNTKYTHHFAIQIQMPSSRAHI